MLGVCIVQVICIVQVFGLLEDRYILPYMVSIHGSHLDLNGTDVSSSFDDRVLLIFRCPIELKLYLFPSQNTILTTGGVERRFVSGHMP